VFHFNCVDWLLKRFLAAGALTPSQQSNSQNTNSSNGALSPLLMLRLHAFSTEHAAHSQACQMYLCFFNLTVAASDSPTMIYL
jgi:hypothetical protein